MDEKEINIEIERKAREILQTKQKTNFRKPEEIHSLDEICKKQKNFIPEQIDKNVILKILLALFVGFLLASILCLVIDVIYKNPQHIDLNIKILCSIGLIGIIPIKNIYWMLTTSSSYLCFIFFLSKFNAKIVNDVLIQSVNFNDKFFLYIFILYIVLFIVNIILFLQRSLKK